MYPPEIVEALKDSLRTIYWYKNQLRSFLQHSGVPEQIIQQQRWDDPQEYKIKIIDKVVDELVAGKEKYIAVMRGLIQRVKVIEDFSHLLKLEDGRKLKKEAEVTVERLKQLVEKHDIKLKQERSEQEERAKAANKRFEQGQKFKQLETLKKEFADLQSLVNANERGRRFEPFLYNLLNYFDLQPRHSFSVIGEQIDGAFEMDGLQFILEAKWEKRPIGAREVRAFKEQIESKLDNTLGLFISFHGFTKEGISAVQRTRPNLILMDGSDLAQVLEGFIDLRELLKRKLRHAAQTGNIYISCREILLDT